MRKFIEKLFIIMLCLFETTLINDPINIVFYLLFSIIISFSLDLITDKNLRFGIYTIFLGLFLYDSTFIYYLPLILYNLYIDLKNYSLISMISILFHISPIFILTSFLSFYLSKNTNEFYKSVEENKIVRDELKEDAIYLKKYNEQLKIDKEKNIHIAVLTERNRIAREIHDSIGHTISSSILQVEALKMTSSKIEELKLLQETLQNGMNDIRNSIHNLYNESLDLKTSIENICKDISAIDIDIVYRIDTNLSYDLKFNILSIIKEAITNSMKHSNSTKLKISLLEQPNFYSIVIKDNGNNSTKNFNIDNGIGLLSMNEIANKYNGFLNYEFDNGFKIHITLMKG